MNEDTREIRSVQPPIEKRGHWYLITGLVLGFLLGLLYTRWINPVVYESTDPASLREEFKETYRSTIAQVYAASGNLERATRRLALLEDENPIHALGGQAQRALAAGDEVQARALALLASALQAAASQDANQSVPTLMSTMEFIPTQTLPAPTPTP
ncbi:MAG: hypothetical protein ACOX7C_05185 [Brevefilum sp.]|jgi:hypothetical protein